MPKPVPLQHGLYRDVKLMPLSHHAPNHVKGGLVDPEKFPLYARHKFNGTPVDCNALDLWCAPRLIEGKYIFGGLIMPHFGHFIAECIHRLWVSHLDEYNGLPVIFLAGAESEASERLLSFIKDHYGIETIVIVREPVTVEELVIAEDGKHMGSSARPEYISWLNKNISIERYKNPSLPSKLFVTRSHLTAGSIVGERHLEAWLNASGYHAFRPEEHTLEKQISHIVSAEKLIFTEGSALHLLDLLPKLNAEAIAIRRRPYTKAAKASLHGKVAHYHIYNRVARVLHNNAVGQSKYDRALSYVNIEDLKHYIRGCGFVDIAFEGDVVDPCYADELTRYYRAEIEDTADGLDDAIKQILDSELERFATLSQLRYRFRLSRAYWAINMGAYAEALSHIHQALEIYPRSPILQELKEKAIKGEKRCQTVVGRLWDRLARSLRILTGPRQILPVQPPEAFYDRPL